MSKMIVCSAKILYVNCNFTKMYGLTVDKEVEMNLQRKNKRALKRGL